MPPILPRNLSQALSAFFDEGVEFLVVGAVAVGVHDVPRATGALDLWVRRTSENAVRVWRALARFGAPLEHVGPAEFEVEDMVYQFGLPPERIDVMTSVSGVTWEEAWSSRVMLTHDGRSIPVIGAAALITNTEASGRAKDLRDAERLRESARRRS
ncbi:MAG: hypothetical protein MUF00_17535 [Gemmatimonadaceae bacterium]|jgi:hypothetical protein|nr:hypothetical protein [Gemmatimonadaceae bacterium]